MTEPVPKGFKVPKRRQESKDNLRQVDVTSRDAAEIVNTVRRTYLENNYRSPWELKTVHFIENRELEEKYRQKRSVIKDALKESMKESAKDSRSSRVDVPEQYAFLMFRDNTSVTSIVKDGLMCHKLGINTLGDSKLGVYVGRNADLQLKMAESWSLTSCVVIVFKVTLGKCKTMSGQFRDELIEPTPNYDCHVHQSQPKLSDPLKAQMTRSEVYLYEYTDDCEPSPYPRQVLPYAVLTFDKSEVPQAPSISTDSYSRRKPVEPSRSDSTEAETCDTKSSRDPRKNSTEMRPPTSETKPSDPRLVYQEASGSLCVPRLTAGPPADPRISSAPGPIPPPVPPPIPAPVPPQMLIDPSLPPTSAQLVLQQLAMDPRLAGNRPRGVPPPGVPPSGVPPPQGIPPPQGVPPPMMVPHPPSYPPGAFNPAGPMVRPPGATQDPRLQAGLNPDSNYVPSFGPSEEELQTRLELLKKVQESIPAHARKDPRLQNKDPRLQNTEETRNKDPRLQNVEERNKDPRLKSAEEPRSRDPRLQRQDDNKPSSRDPRMERSETKDVDHRPRDPRMKHHSRPHRPRAQVGDEAGRKKLSLNEYKQKVSIPPPVKPSETAILQSTPSGTLGGPASQPSTTISSNIYESPINYYTSGPEAIDNDDVLSPASRSPSPYSPDEMESGAENDGMDEDTHEVVHRPADMYSILQDLSDPDDVSLSPKEDRFTYEEKTEPDHMELEQEKQTITDPVKDEPVNQDPVKQDPVKQDPVKPDPATEEPIQETKVSCIGPSVSGSSSKESVDQEEEEDPVLAEAMKKLVEYTSNVPLFTAALRSLQESAEEYGDSLTNPVFLVKKIAEYIDQLAKDKESEHSQEETASAKESEDSEVKKDASTDDKPDQDKDNVYGDESIKSPDDMDISEDNVEEPQTLPVPEIPLESDEPNSNQNSSPTDVIMSPLSKAMKKTLEEYVPEHVSTVPSAGQGFPFGNKSIQDTVYDQDKRANTRPDLPKRNITMELTNIPLPPSPVKSSVSKHAPESSIVNKKPGFSFNLKKRTISPETIANIFKDDTQEEEQQDIDVRKKPSFLPPSKSGNRQLPSADIDVDLRTGDKDLRKLQKPKKDQDMDFRKKTSSSSKTASYVIKPAKDTNIPVYKPTKIANKNKPISSIDMFDEPLDRDERFSQKTKKWSSDKVDSKPALDPSYLDRDERQTGSRGGSPKISSVFMDIDERSNSSASLSSVFKRISEDRDDRTHSRSQSPTPAPPDSSTKLSQESQAARGGSQETTTTATVKAENISTNSSSSEDDNSLFDAYAMNKKPVVAKPKVKEKDAGNEFGDVDWRMTAAAEMGDVDLRGSQSSVTQPDLARGTQSTRAQTSMTQSRGMHGGDQDLRGRADPVPGYPNTSYGFYPPPVAPAVQAYHQQPVEQYHTHTSVETYSTSIPGLEAYSTSKVPSYSTHQSHRTSHHPEGDPGIPGLTYKPATSVNPPGHMQNLMQNLDFSNLKNILATVQKPPGETGQAVGESRKATAADDDDDERENQPAFCTGLSFLKSKQPKVDLARAKYSGFATVPPDVGPPPVVPPVPIQPLIKPVVPKPVPPPKPLLPPVPPSLLDMPLPPRPPFESPTKKGGKSLFDHAMFDSSTPKASRSNVIPGFDEPVEDENISEDVAGDSSKNPGSGIQPFKFSEEIPDRDFSSEWYEKEEGHRGDLRTPEEGSGRSRSDSRRHEKDERSDSGGRDSKKRDKGTPTKSKHRDKEKESKSTPKPVSSWQQAILESMEESALKVRHDDTFTSDVPESPVVEAKCAKTLFESDKTLDEKATTDEGQGDAEVESKKRKLEKPEDEARKVQKIDDSDESDDEAGLIIDLTADTSALRDTTTDSPRNRVETPPTPTDEYFREQAKLRKHNGDDNEGDVINVDESKGDNSGDEAEAEKPLPDGKVSTKILPDGKVVTTKVFQDNIVPTKSDDMKSMIEKSRKNMVIKLKGETKIVNPKTGKAYNESIVGSAIQVVGQASKPAKPERPPSQKLKIHPIHGVSSSSTTSQTGSKTSSASQRSYRSPSPGPRSASPISTLLSGGAGFRSTSPVNQMAPFGQPPPQQLPPGMMKQYVHPVTGQSVPYGIAPLGIRHMDPPPPGTQIIPPPLGLPMPVPGPGQPPQGFVTLTRPPISMAINPSMVLGAGLVQRPPLVVIGTGSQLGPVSPMGLSPQGDKRIGDTGPQRPLGMAIQTIGQAPQGSAKPSDPKLEKRKSSSDVFDWFSDKFEKRDTGEKSSSFSPVVKQEPSFSVSSVTVKPEPNYQFSQNTANKVIRTVPESNMSANTNIRTLPESNTNNTNIRTVSESNLSANTNIRTIPESNLRQIDTGYGRDESIDRKRPALQTSDSGTEPKKFCSESDSSKGAPYKGNLISISTTESRVKDSQDKGNLISISTNVKEEPPSDNVKDTTDTAASSELEDGEISDDSTDESISPFKQQSDDDYRRVVMHDRSSIPVIGSWQDSYSSPNCRIPTLGSSNFQNSPKRIVNVKSEPPRHIRSLDYGSDRGRSSRAGSDWASMLQGPDTSPIETIGSRARASHQQKHQQPAPHKQSQSQSQSQPHLSTKGQFDESALLSKSAASISKTKQKIVAKSQVKTLGDWLKLELETDNILPLQKIIMCSRARASHQQKQQQSAPHKQSQSQHHLSSKGQFDESALLSKSAASISKTKQKIVAKSQVKTLGDWLKLELETDNILPSRRSSCSRARASHQQKQQQPAPHKQSQSQPHLSSKGQFDESALLSKSAASISKTKQKIVAKSQVKTLGDWLKLELETDNILPLQKIIPYSLNTDLTIIPKQRRRKIRLKVKNAIEQEGLKKITKVEVVPSSQERSEPVKSSTDTSTPPDYNVIMRSRPESMPSANTESRSNSGPSNTHPEVDHRQIERELKLIENSLAKLRSKPIDNITKVIVTLPGMQNDQSLLFALSAIENEMKILLQRTCFYGYPHRRVPNELLLESELHSFQSSMTDVFLILMMPISTKPYHKLLVMKKDLERLIEELGTAPDKEAIQAQIANIHSQRQAILRSFTGYLNKRRILKVQDSVDKYTQAYDHFKHLQPPVPDTSLKFIRTTQMDLRQHLILAKQYFALEEKKNGK